MTAGVKILHVFDHSVPLHSGYAFRSLAILGEQRRLGWHTAQLTSTKHEQAVGALTTPPRLREVSSERVDGFEFHRTPFRGALADRVPVLGQWRVVTTLRRRLGEVNRDFDARILHAHSPSLNGLAALGAARKRRLPVVYELRASWEDAAVDHGTARRDGFRYRASRALESDVLRRADAIVTICEGLRQEVIGRGVAPERVTVVPNAVDVEAFQPGGRIDPDLRARLGLNGAPVLGFIGSFYAYEGLALLLRALPAILGRWPKTKVLLVGGGLQEAELKRRVTENGLGDSVLFTGRVSHDVVRAYYDLIDVLVYPRLSMRLTELVTPLKPLEAMAHGRLVVASDVGGHHELIRDGNTGMLFRAGDATALAARVADALESGERGIEIRTAARRFVETERTWRAVVRRYAVVYESICGTARSRSTPP